MVLSETYHINQEWAGLTLPLKSRLTHQNGSRDALLERLHEAGLAQFKETGVPGRKNEDWKYTPLRSLTKIDWKEAQVEEGTISQIETVKAATDAYHCVFINGRFQEAYSDAMPEGITMLPFAQHIPGDFREAIQVYLDTLETVKMTPFEALTCASTMHGRVFMIAPSAQIDKPVHCIYVSTQSREPYLSYPYRLFILGRHAKASCLDTFIGTDNAQISLTNGVTHVQLDAESVFDHYRMQNENAASYHIQATRVFQQRSSTYTSVAAELGGKMARSNIEVLHQGTGITTNLFGLFIGRNHQHLDTQSFIDHAVPHCESHELYKGILDDSARGVFNGKILVRKDAQKTNAFQQNNTLVLSGQAVMDSKPQLEIFADDVKCSHGATIGQLDEESLFYLRSRGLTRKQASAMLQRAFIGEVLDKCPDDEIKSYFWKIIAAAQDV